MRLNSNRRGAFSLIELSIVLIIIGLLIAGVTGGASLIKSSELRSVITESRTWSVSVNSFFNQFDNLPGDFDGALGDPVGGDGDGRIEYDNGTSTNNARYEGRNAWRHLSITNILDSSVIYSSYDNTIEVSDIPTTALSTFGNSIPSSKLGSAGWDFDYNTTSTHNVVVLTGNIAASTTATVDTLVNGTVKTTGVLTPVDALSLDAKYDDGDPTTGSVQGVGVVGTANTSCYNGTSYYTVNTDENCALSFRVDVNT